MYLWGMKQKSQWLKDLEELIDNLPEHTEYECELCGHKTEGITVIRTCYVKRDGKCDPMFYSPYITADELPLLQYGFNDLCVNRRQCQDRQRKNNQQT